MTQGDPSGADGPGAPSDAPADMGRRDLFLATLAHELRGPLAPLRNSLYALRIALPDARSAAQLIEIMDRQVTQLAALLDGLLDLERFTSGCIQLQEQTVDLADVTAQCVGDRRLIFDGKGVALEARLECPLWVVGDPVRLQQIVTELLSNALHFTGAGGTVRVTGERDPAHGLATLRVLDTGAGFAAEQLSTLFLPFRGGDLGAATAAGSGLGLGLATVQTLAKLHHAEVTARSEGIGRGAEFAFSIPLASRA